MTRQDMDRIALRTVAYGRFYSLDRLPDPHRVSEAGFRWGRLRFSYSWRVGYALEMRGPMVQLPEEFGGEWVSDDAFWTVSPFCRAAELLRFATYSQLLDRDLRGMRDTPQLAAE